MTSEALLLNVDGEQYEIPWETCSPRLKQASEIERQHAELSPGGYGVHWPLIDEDLSVWGLLNRAGG